MPPRRPLERLARAAAGPAYPLLGEGGGGLAPRRATPARYQRLLLRAGRQFTSRSSARPCMTVNYRGGLSFVPGKSSGVFLLVCRCFVQTTGFPLENIALLCDDIVHCNRQPTYQTAYKLFIVTYC